MANQSITSILAGYTKDSVDAINSAIKSASNNNITAYRALQDYKKTAPFQKQETAKEILERVKAEEDLAEFQKQTIEANREGLSRKDYVARNNEQREYVERLRAENRELAKVIDKEAREEAAKIRTEERKAQREAQKILDEKIENEEIISERVKRYAQEGMFLTKNLAEGKFPKDTLEIKNYSDIIFYDNAENQPDITTGAATFTLDDFAGLIKNGDIGHPESGIKKIVEDDKIIFQTVPFNPASFGPYIPITIEINSDDYSTKSSTADFQKMLLHYLESPRGARLKSPYKINIINSYTTDFKTDKSLEIDRMLNYQSN